MQLFATAVALFALRAVSAGPVPRANPPRKDIIFDTDLLSFPDDAGAIALGNVFVQQNKARILGIASNVNSSYAIPAIDAINTYYHHPNAFFGQTKDVHANDLEPNTAPGKYPVFIEALADTTRFPESPGKKNITTPLDFYTRLLKNADDNSVTIIAIGFLDNLNELYNSQGGPDLIKRKVAELVVQGGDFGPKTHPPGLNRAGFNMDTNITAALVLEKWPSQVTYLGGNIGSNVLTGAVLKDTPPNNPVKAAYEIFLGGPGRNNGTWDALATYYAVLGLDDDLTYGNANGSGRIQFHLDTTTPTHSTAEWNYAAPVVGKQRFLNFSRSDSNATLAKKVDNLFVVLPTP